MEIPSSTRHTVSVQDKISEINIGIRFARSFRVLDMSGEIIDNILTDPDSPFDVDYFPKFKEGTLREKILLNNKGDKITLTSDDFVFTLNINKDFDNKNKFITNEFFRYLYKLFDMFSIENISRVGILFNCNLDKNDDQINQLVKNITNDSVQVAQSFNLAFSQKKKADIGFLKSGVGDYVNTIYILERENNTEETSEDLLFKFDYQKYYIPNLTSLKSGKIEEQFKDATASLDTSYVKWINKYDE